MVLIKGDGNMDMFPNGFNSEDELDAFIASPSNAVVEMMRRIKGDIIVLGIAGKMGIHLGMMLVEASKVSGIKRRIIGVSRFSDVAARQKLEACGVKTIACDLLDRDAVDKLPDADNVIFMAGKKFGTAGAEDATWAMNTVVPSNICLRYAKSRIVAYSTGCVYPLVTAVEGGSVETDIPQPIGDYAMSALGRERVFSYYANNQGPKVCIVRLNYACDMRYGVLHDIAANVMAGRPVDCGAGHVNLIWQGDAIAYSLLCLEHCSSPASIMNVTGPETVPVRYLAAGFAKRFGVAVQFSGTEGRTYINNAAKAFSLFGYPRVPLVAIMDWTAEWLKKGGRSLGKPTHFEVGDGKF